MMNKIEENNKVQLTEEEMDKIRNSIEFVYYSSPCWAHCHGGLLVKILGEYHLFGNESKDDPFTMLSEEDRTNIIEHESFWVSGGSVSWDPEYVETGEWELGYYEDLGWLEPFVDDLLDVMNENVEWGCCGGCI